MILAFFICTNITNISKSLLNRRNSSNPKPMCFRSHPLQYCIAGIVSVFTYTWVLFHIWRQFQKLLLQFVLSFTSHQISAFWREQKSAAAKKFGQATNNLELSCLLMRSRIVSLLSSFLSPPIWCKKFGATHPDFSASNAFLLNVSPLILTRSRGIIYSSIVSSITTSMKGCSICSLQQVHTSYIINPSVVQNTVHRHQHFKTWSDIGN